MAGAGSVEAAVLSAPRLKSRESPVSSWTTVKPDRARIEDRNHENPVEDRFGDDWGILGGARVGGDWPVYDPHQERRRGISAECAYNDRSSIGDPQLYRRKYKAAARSADES